MRQTTIGEESDPKLRFLTRNVAPTANFPMCVNITDLAVSDYFVFPNMKEGL